MTLRLRNVQVDVPASEHRQAVDFWAAALGARSIPQGDPAFTHLAGVPGLFGLHVQALQEGAPRIHLDLEADNVDAEVARLVDLGATVHGDGAGGPILTDPAGIVFCVVGSGTDDVLRRSNDDDARLHVLVLDVASEHAEDAGRFWGQAFGRDAEPLPAPFDAYIRIEDAPAVGGALRVLVQDIGAGAAPRVHVDLHVPDVKARSRHVERLSQLGASVVDRTYSWTVMTDPFGLAFCVVPDRPDPQ